MRINVGCGRHILEGWINCDVARSPKASRDPEILAQATAIPLPDACADEVMGIHIFEHFYFWEAPKALAEWHRLLKPGGLLVLEMPDVKKCAKNLISLIDGEDVKSIASLAMHGIYGDPGYQDPFMCHRWGWTPKTLRKLLSASGFAKIKEADTQWHAIGRKLRDFRMEARKA
jgi:ubiquinone/menaquinone biosynthesis C-methylase UbiE